jgi:GNAT superfamily N-acetyltransferase
MTMHTYTLEERPDLVPQAEAVNASAGPAFMEHDEVANRLWDRLARDFAAYQFVLCDEADIVIAAGNAVPVTWDSTLQGLPDAGWDGILQRAADDFDAGRTPDALAALSVAVAPGHQAKGLGGAMLEGMHAIARAHGFTTLIAPVRPTLKCAYPLTPIERNVHWTRDDGAPFDPWLRAHWRVGARILGLASRSMCIRGTVKEWEEWAGMPFPESGMYVVPGALTTVSIDCEKDEGVYVEPGVWMKHDASDKRL